MRRWPLFVFGSVSIAMAVAAIGIGSVDRFGVENVSPSMDLGLYVRVPKGEIEVGDIVEFPVPSWARNFADAHCITGPILKRVTWAKDGELLVSGDHMPERSFDSDIYGAIPVEMVTGKYVPLWTRPPSEVAQNYRSTCEHED